MENLYVLGHPVAHSKSPVMHNALYRALGLDWRYELMDCPVAADAERFLEDAAFLGINITMPYKPHAFRRADAADVSAVLAQGANVLVWEGEADRSLLKAYNMDGYGCVRYLERERVVFDGARVVVCGTGPTSLAIMHAVAVSGAARVTLLGRSLERTQATMRGWLTRFAEATGEGEETAAVAGLAAEMVAAGPAEAGAAGEAAATSDVGAAGEVAATSDVGAAGAFAVRCAVAEDACSSPAAGLTAEMVAGSYDTHASEIEQATLVIDATPLGMNPDDPAPFDPALLRTETTVFDVVYGHGETALSRGAREHGCRFLNGEGMLVGQAVLGAEKFLASAGSLDDTGLDFDFAFEVMAKAAGFSVS